MGFLQRAYLLLTLALVPLTQVAGRKEIDTFTATQLTLSTPWSAAKVLANLDVALNRKKNDADFLASAVAKVVAGNQTAFENLVNSSIGPFGFVTFGTYTYDLFMPWYSEGATATLNRRFTIGNPLLASTMVEHDPRAANHVPVDLSVMSDYGLNGVAPNGGVTTRIVWDLPSSLIAINGQGKKGTEVRALWDATQILDQKLESLVRNVTGN